MTAVLKASDWPNSLVTAEQLDSREALCMEYHVCTSLLFNSVGTFEMVVLVMDNYSILHLCITLLLRRATVQYYPVLHGQIRMRS